MKQSGVRDEVDLSMGLLREIENVQLKAAG
jgi:hypothetical protein